MRSLSFLWAVALAVIWVDAARAEAVDSASADRADAVAADAKAAAEDDPFAEFAAPAEPADDAEATAEPVVATEEEAAEPAADDAAESAGAEGGSTDGAGAASSEPTSDTAPGANPAPEPGATGAAAETASSLSRAADTAPRAAGARAPGRSAAVRNAGGQPVVIGPVGVDEQGRRGRIHTVGSGDTLWDISNAYLGTPWVWPSVWHENDENIENPHVIRPGDLIWITSTEMRRVTSEEAAALMAGVPGDETGEEVAAVEEPATADGPAEETVEPGPAAVAVDVTSIDLPADIDDGALSEPGQGRSLAPAGGTLRVPWRESMSFVASETVEAETSIVSSTLERTWIAEGDRIVVGFGEGEVQPGDQFTVFRDHEPVRDMDGRLLGYQVEVLGWIQIEEVYPETSTATVEFSVSEMRAGDLLAPREVPPREVTIREAPTEFEGYVVHFPDHRTVVGMGDYVYLDKGAIHGLEVGSHLQVVTPSEVHRESVSRTKVATPVLPVADLVVTFVRPDASVAIVSTTRTEIERGAHVRAASPQVASLQ